MGTWRKVTMTAGLIGLISAHALAEAPPPDSWPMFRGSQALLGVSKVEFPANTFGPLWNFKTQGPVKSSPAIDGRRVFVGSSDQHLYALDLQTGKKLWAFKTDGPIESSPLVLANRVYIGSSDGGLYSVNAADGRLLWKYVTGEKIIGSPNWFKPANGPVSVITGSYDYMLHCVDAATGKSNW